MSHEAGLQYCPNGVGRGAWQGRRVGKMPRQRCWDQALLIAQEAGTHENCTEFHKHFRIHNGTEPWRVTVSS